MRQSLFSMRWILTTLLVLAAVGVMVRLGFWQLERLEQRRTFNARVGAQLDAPELDLNDQYANPDLAGMEYRRVVVAGRYEPAQQVVLRNRVWNNQPGVELITPLVIEGTDQAVLINRGWIPLEDFSPERWGQYDEPGRVVVRGVIRRSQEPAGFAARPDPELAPGQNRLEAWNFVNLERIRAQVDAPILPVYVQQAPEPGWQGPPVRSQPTLDLTEGSHLGYALQWFSFAAILGLGYPFFVNKMIRNRKFEVREEYEG